MKKKLKTIPKFKNEDEEREFWSSHDSTQYLDWSKAMKGVTFPNLQLSTESISLRLSSEMLGNLKTISRRKDIPYQSYIKMILDEKISKELAKR